MTEEKKEAAQETAISAEISMSQRFTSKVLSEFTTSSGDVNVGPHQRSLIQGYFIGLDQALKKAEVDRVRKNASASDQKYMNDLPYTWANVDLEQLARSVMHYSKIGHDMMLPNQLSPIAYKNNATNKYVFTFVEGYMGKRFMAEKYALVKSKAVTIELVREKDSFEAIKKGQNQPYDSYQFKIINPFDRGEVIGGFGYIEYDDPTKNELHIMTMADIMKRKPDKASAEFWGGEKTVYVDGKKSTKEIEGWRDEMIYKTVSRYVYGKIPLDSSKVSEFNNFSATQQDDVKELEVAAEISEKANVESLDIEDAEYTEVASEDSQDPNKEEKKPEELFPSTPPSTPGPGF